MKKSIFMIMLLLMAMPVMAGYWDDFGSLFGGDVGREGLGLEEEGDVYVSDLAVGNLVAEETSIFDNIFQRKFFVEPKTCFEICTNPLGCTYTVKVAKPRTLGEQCIGGKESIEALYCDSKLNPPCNPIFGEVYFKESDSDNLDLTKACAGGSCYNQGFFTKATNNKVFAYRCKSCTFDSIFTCDDPDGGVKKYIKKGMTIVKKKNEIQNSRVDKCKSSKDLEEYYCASSKTNKGEVASKIIPCTYGCKDGVCLQPADITFKCKPDTKQCSGNTRQRCRLSGTTYDWEDLKNSCSYKCSKGVCVDKPTTSVQEENQTPTPTPTPTTQVCCGSSFGKPSCKDSCGFGFRLITADDFDYKTCPTQCLPTNKTEVLCHKCDGKVLLNRTFTGIGGCGKGWRTKGSLDLLSCKDGASLVVNDTDGSGTIIKKPTQTSLTVSDIREATSTTLLSAVCNEDKNCKPYDDTSDFKVACKTNTKYEQIIKEAAKDKCGDFTLTKIGAIAGAGACAVGVGVTLASGFVGSPALVLCGLGLTGASALTTIDLGIYSGCKLYQEGKGEGLCIATKKEGELFDQIKSFVARTFNLDKDSNSVLFILGAIALVGLLIIGRLLSPR